MNIIKKKISSWSYFQKLNCNVVYPKNIEELKKTLHFAKKNNLSIIAMGTGCSFGDLFMHSKGIVINCKNLNRIVNFNSKDKTLVVEPGISVSQVNQFLFHENLTINSIPSNFEITVGGAIANNVYGKDSYKKGYFCNNISKITYIDDNLNIKTISKKEDKNNFENFIGTIGLLGIIIEIEIVGAELKSQYLKFTSHYLKNFEEFFNFSKKINIKNIPFFSIKIDPYSKKDKFGRAFVYTYDWDLSHYKDNKNKMRDIHLFKKINLLGNFFYLSRKKYNFIKNFLFSVFSLLSNRFVWKALNTLSFSYFKFKNNKVGKVHVLDLYNNNNFTNHNLLFKPRGFYSLQILIPIANYYVIINKLLKLIQQTKNEPFLCQLMFLPKRNDFIYEMDDHVAFTIPFLKKRDSHNQEIFIKDIIQLITDNKCQLLISKDNILDKNSSLKIFPKIKEFIKLKNKTDKNCFFSSSYYERTLKQ